MGKLEGKICLITGAARGQGAAEADLFASEGADVWRVDVLDAEGQAVVSKLGAQDRHLDVTNEAGWQSVVEESVAKCDGLHVLVNNERKGVINYIGMSEPTLTQMFGKDAFDEMCKAYPVQLRQLIKSRFEVGT